MKQTVTIIQAADRHADLTDRSFAHCEMHTVAAADLAAVLRSVAERVDLPAGRYSILIDWPHT